jgi:hypothetical protein
MFFSMLVKLSSRITRQSVNNLLVVPKAKTEYYRRSFVISSCNLWNNMSNEMRESTSLKFLKTKYLNEYFNREYYMALSVSHPVSTRDTNIIPRALARGMILVES